MKTVLISVFVFALLAQQQVQGAEDPVRAMLTAIKKGAAEEVKGSPKSIPEEDFENFLEIQTELHRANRLDQEVVNSTLQNHLELISNLNQAMGFLLDRIDYLQGQIEDLTNSTKDINTALGAVSTRLTQTETKANDALEKYKSCITDVRFGALEKKAVFKGPGYIDQKSYLISAVENHNSDEFPDSVYRRRCQVYRNGAWVDPVWQ